MKLFDTNKPSEEDDHEPKLDAKMQSLFGPKRIIHNSKPVSHPGYGNRRPASIFRHRSPTPPETGNQPFAALAVGAEARADKRCIPYLRLRTHVNAGKKSPPFKLQSESRLASRGGRVRRAYRDLASGFSLFIKVIVVAILLVKPNHINKLKTTVNNLFSGLCRNFVDVDNASVITSLTVDMQVPIEFILPIQQNQDHDASTATLGAL